jgi:hypothetical protein
LIIKTLKKIKTINFPANPSWTSVRWCTAECSGDVYEV